MAKLKYNEPIPVFDEDDNWHWAAAAYAAKQPRGNAHWQAVVNELIVEFELYLAFFAEAKS